MNQHATREFIRMLQQIGIRELAEDERAEVNKLVQASLAEIVVPALADRFEYTSTEIFGFGSGPVWAQGLTLRESGLPVSRIIAELSNASEESLTALFRPLGLTAEQGDGALSAAYWVMSCLTWESRDRKIPHEWPVESTESYLAATLRSLQNYRETGEP